MCMHCEGKRFNSGTDLSFNKAYRNVHQSNVVRLFDIVFHKTHNASLELLPLVMLSMKHLNHRSCLALWVKESKNFY